MQGDDATKQAAENVLALEEELENVGHAMTGSSQVEELKRKLHAWIDEVVGVVSSPGLGRVTLIHQGGRTSSISSAELPALMSPPARFDADDDAAGAAQEA